MADTTAIKEGIRRFLMRQTVESWGYSGFLDGLRSQDKANPNSPTHIQRINQFAFELWHGMDAYNWIGRNCKSCYNSIWETAIRELVKEKAGIGWIK